MANFNVGITYEYDSELGGRLNFSTAALDELWEGDTITFTLTTNTSDTITISGFGSSFWTNTGNLTLSSNGQTATKTVKTGVVKDSTTNITASGGGDSDTLSCVFPGAPDFMPDAFGFGNITNANPKTMSGISVTVSGITRKVGATIDNGGEIVVSASGQTLGRRRVGSWPQTIRNGDKVSFYFQVPLDYGLTDTYTVTIGDRTETFTVSTKTFPDVDELILLGIDSGDIRLKADIGYFFGMPYPNEASLTEYYRGGGRVPNISINQGIPTSGDIKETQFYGSGSGFYFIYVPSMKAISYDTLQGASTQSVAWFADVDYVIGFGPYATSVEYAYEYTVNTIGDAQGSSLSITTRDGKPHGTFDLDNDWFQFDVYCPGNTEVIWHGTLTIKARNYVDANELIISRTVNWSIAFYGP